MNLDSQHTSRARFHEDPSRPHYHYLPPANWMNDPNGVIQWDGRYHLFYQYNPGAAYHADMHWGHAVSDDLMHWQDLPIALAPTPGTVDEGGIFSGCAVDHNGVPTIFYTGVDHGANVQVQCMATGNEDLTQWEKYPGNPILRDVPIVSGQTQDFRDPFVWKDGDTWYMLVGSQIHGVGGTAFLYQSQDLTIWQYLNPLYVGDKAENGVIWECPNFFPLDDKWVLIISAHTGEETGDVKYFVGNYADHRFTPEVHGVLDNGSLYAPLTMQADDGRRLLWGWLREERTVKEHTAAGWAGVQSLPRELSLDAQNRLIMRPVEEAAVLQREIYTQADAPVSQPQTLPVRGQALDIEANISLAPGGTFTLSVLCDAESDTSTDIHYDTATGQLVLQRTGGNASSATHTLAPNELLSLRVLVDGSVIELIANRRTSITGRHYPTRFEQDHVRIDGQNAHIVRLRLCEMQSIWK